MNRLHFTCSLITAVVAIINSSHELSVKDESELNNFYSEVICKLDELKESAALFQKALAEQSDAIQQLTEKQSQTEQALNKTISALLVTDTSKLNLGVQLLSAVKNGDTKQVSFLLELNAPIEYEDSEKNRPIHVAVRNRVPQVLEILVNNKADINAKGIYKQTALIMAGAYNCVECARILLDKGADMTIRDQWGNTPIVHPARVGYKEFVELLLSRGADINEGESQGMSGLHWAARDGHLPIVQLLIQKGANVRLKNQAGKTPLDEAVSNNHPLVADYLRTILKSK